MQLDCRRLFIRIHAFDRNPSTLTIPLVSRRGGRRTTVSLLTWVTRRAARRRRVATRTALRPRRTTWRRLVLLVRAAGGRLVLLLATVATLLLELIKVDLRGRADAASREGRLSGEGAHVGRGAKVVTSAHCTGAWRAKSRASGLRSAVPVADYVAGRHVCCSRKIVARGGERLSQACG